MKTSIVKLKQAALITGIALSGIASSGAFTPTNAALIFNFIPPTVENGGIDPNALQGFIDAGALWSSLLTDDVEVNIDISFQSLGGGILAQAGSTRQRFSYANTYAALNGDKLSGDDTQAVGSLANSSAFNMLINRTANRPTGSLIATPYLDNDGDANNSTINMSRANAKALGLTNGTAATPIFNNVMEAGFTNPITSAASTNAAAMTLVLSNAGAPDAAITFNSDFDFDFDSSNGFDPDSFDFVGIAAHEIGHVLGFTSGVDTLEFLSTRNDNTLTFVNTLDLFRYSDLSNQDSNGGAIDWSADTRDKYFSLNRGATKIASFSTGSRFGDGSQASHWQDDGGLGIMDPTFAREELGVISENDLRAFDVIGWNRATTATAIPEPADFAGTVIFAAFTTKMVLNRRKQLGKLTEKSVKS
jgi:hypothetical protein